jgi:murein DD-endopeptidase MepM/ murein hydrolase activator NlpD
VPVEVKKPTPRELLLKEGYREASVTLDGPLETALGADVGRGLAPALAQVVARTLVWWVDVPEGLRRGDGVDVLFQEREGAEPEVDAVVFRSEKLGRTVRAYRYRAPDAQFSRFFQPDGHELELRLRDAPIDDYEQVTSLIRDGRGHKGVDFKTPVGTPVKATFSGQVVRRNWNFRGNGNSIEVHESGGHRRAAIFLHLSEVEKRVHPGAHVERGQLIAHSGNTGHSFAPHLHYQLMSPAGKVLDPFASHETYRRALPADQKAAFAAEVARLDKLIDLGRPISAR